MPIFSCKFSLGHAIGTGLQTVSDFGKTELNQLTPSSHFVQVSFMVRAVVASPSLVRAGLVPALETDILPVVVSAIADGTEERLWRSIVSACPKFAETHDACSLPEIFRAIRSQHRITGHRCVLVVIDQFEQWLNGRHTMDSELVDALRQCDGVRLKCLFLVRNDFWMSISRFMDDLEAPIEQGNNAAPVELFDLRHARRVLFAFGHAYGALPSTTEELTDSQKQFLDESVQQLSRDGRVICVRLAVYAQMIRDKPWEPQTLSLFGGVKGLGARFLEETFYGSSSEPQYMRFQTPAQEVLRSLLPSPGTDIRGAMLSENELAKVSKLPERGFRDLMKLLGDHLRLVTPTDVDGGRLASDHANSSQQTSGRYYQLTHDYLVPSLRTWLSAKQRETAIGRAWLCLEDRSALWEMNRETRQLPGWSETLRIAALTRHSEWTPTQSMMMSHAKRLRSTQAIIAGLLFVLLMLGFSYGRSRMRQSTRQRTADALVDQVKTARNAEVMSILHKLDDYSNEADSSLKESVSSRAPRSRDLVHARAESRQYFFALLALSRAAGEWSQQLLDACADANSDYIVLAKRRLAPFAVEVEPEIVSRFSNTNSPQEMLRYATLMSDSRTILSGNQQKAAQLSEALVDLDPYDLAVFTRELSYAKQSFTPSLVDIFHDPERNETQRSAAARPLAEYANEDQLIQLMLTASPTQHFVLISNTQNRQDRVVQRLEHELSTLKDPPIAEASEVQKQANAVLALLRLSPESVWIGKTLSQKKDLTARTRVIFVMP